MPPSRSTRLDLAAAGSPTQPALLPEAYGRLVRQTLSARARAVGRDGLAILQLGHNQHGTR